MHRRFAKATRSAEGQRSQAREYRDVNVHRPKEHHDYDDYRLDWRPVDGYFVRQCIGSGRYSEVYEGANGAKERCVIKILKPVKMKKIRREVKILETLKEGPNIIKLLEVIWDENNKTPSLVFEFCNNYDYRFLYPTLGLEDIRYYLYQLLKALDYAHSQGVMHRDIKPHNIVIDHDLHKLRLIDWGLAEFYFPGKEYNVRVASRHYKAPELLVDLTDYDYSMDLWGVGCMLAGMVFKKEPFFNGVDNADQLLKITKVLGTEDLYKCLAKYGVELDPALRKALGKRKGRGFLKQVTDHNEHLADDDALDLMARLLRFDHQERMTSREAIGHPFFAPIRAWEGG
ncbi:unnamed protein product [Ostreobium quekettii]|uniref:non-specific serine/threonine protein kinase n=1 Tax=Ostreobium quekettii TaxID=121088 RepID=A0A8S1J9R3_9CHLO|nr:unnamed protein product [Ostreobium quekettii]|eukprot:evm.model.scf_761.5 EVM.evm.TU.scf_761.5   scf_761:37448-43137(-)